MEVIVGDWKTPVPGRNFGATTTGRSSRISFTASSFSVSTVFAVIPVMPMLILAVALLAAGPAGAQTVTATVAAVSAPVVVAVNPVTNKIYVANGDSGNVTVIDGASNAVDATVAAGTGPRTVAVNPVTNKVYVANKNTDTVTVIEEQAVQAIPLTTTITAFPGNQTEDRTPDFAFTALSAFAPTAPPVQGVFYQLDTWQGPWLPASGAAPAFTATAATLPVGARILCMPSPPTGRRPTRPGWPRT